MNFNKRARNAENIHYFLRQSALKFYLSSGGVANIAIIMLNTKKPNACEKSVSFNSFLY